MELDQQRAFTDSLALASSVRWYLRIFYSRRLSILCLLLHFHSHIFSAFHCQQNFRFVTIQACDRHTDRQTDGRTDGWTADDRNWPCVCIRSRTVKISTVRLYAILTFSSSEAQALTQILQLQGLSQQNWQPFPNVDPAGRVPEPVTAAELELSQRFVQHLEIFIN